MQCFSLLKSVLTSCILIFKLFCSKIAFHMDSVSPNPNIITKDLKKKKKKKRQITIELCTFLNGERWDPLIRNLTLTRDISYIKFFVWYFKMFKVNIFLWNHSVEGLAPRLNRVTASERGLKHQLVVVITLETGRADRLLHLLTLPWHQHWLRAMQI